MQQFETSANRKAVVVVDGNAKLHQRGFVGYSNAYCVDTATARMARTSWAKDTLPAVTNNFLPQVDRP